LKTRSWVTLAVIVLAVAGLGAYRSLSSPPPEEEDAKAETVDPGHGLPGIIDFGRGECVACKKMMPVLEELAKRHEGHIVVRYLDLSIPANKKRAAEMDVRLIPTQILIDAEGKEIFRNEGFWSLEDLEFELEALEWIPER